MISERPATSDQSCRSAKPGSPLISSFIARYKSLVPGEASVLAAVSGGGDSTALLHMLHGLRERLGIRRLGVLHVNHGLRGAESDGDERFVAGLAERLGCPFFPKKLDGRSLHAAGMEEWGRRERYRFFLLTMRREGFDVVATGHTADDQAETVLMRVMRGAGLRGMRGVLPKRDDGIIRPMLDLRRQEIVSWLEAGKRGFRSDSSNDDCSFGRNRIRHEVLPRLEKIEPGVREKLTRLAALSNELWASMRPGVDRWIGTHVRGTAGRFGIEKAGFDDELHAGEGLIRVFERYGIPADSRQIEEIITNRDRRGREFLLRGGSWRYHPTKNKVVFIDRREAPPREFLYRIALEGVTKCPDASALFEATESVTPLAPLPFDNLTVALDRDACGDELLFRSVRPTDRFVPLGGSRPVAIGSFMAKQGVARVEYADFGVVETGDGRIVWIPGLRIGQAVRVGRGTKRILKLSYQSYPCAII